MARLLFTDEIGSAVLDNGLTTVAGGVAGRFRDWMPTKRPVGAARHALGTGQRYHFRFRREFGARFRLAEIPQHQLPTAVRLIAHLEDGGTVQVDTGDAEGRVYATCGMAADQPPTIELGDATQRTYVLTLAVINLASGVTAPMLCEYSDLPDDGVLLLLAGPDRLDGITFTRATTATYFTVA